VLGAEFSTVRLGNVGYPNRFGIASCGYFMDDRTAQKANCGTTLVFARRCNGCVDREE
jgi:hypothetical protein